ncbi:DNA recombination protein RmuC [Nocardioides sp. InS609-2]|uniref:DNA recombination protein RmuC n=1 Tax=Nocardioides sp. InS609-2 TaxID=2760705 RepID=UPI0020C102C3|nr:DNA recombination protein RmuC [Nocardioides sp. InS609-2]
MEIVTLFLTLVVGLALGVLVGHLWARSRGTGVAHAALEARAADQAVVAQGLERLQRQLVDLERERAQWQGHFDAQVDSMRLSTDTLRRETSSLSTALRKPQVRGRWGELHLRRAVELAGLVDRCDFTEQARLVGGALRPDLIVRLAGGRSIVVDAKVPLDAFLDATATDDDDLRAHHLSRHAAQLRNHVNALADKAYWRALTESPEFVVMFVPAEAFLSAALDAQTDLLEYAAERRVILATPTTLIALLRTVAHGWSHDRLADQAAEVQRLGRELHERLATMGGNLARLGRSLSAAVGAYNQAVGSIEGRVLVTARKFSELGVTDDALDEPAQVEVTPRSLAAAEFAHDISALGRDADPLDDTLDLSWGERGTGDPSGGDAARRASGA